MVPFLKLKLKVTKTKIPIQNDDRSVCVASAPSSLLLSEIERDLLRGASVIFASKFFLLLFKTHPQLTLPLRRLFGSGV